MSRAELDLNKTPVDELSYEQALAELEGIVKALETDERSLEESIALYERGQLLAQRCARLLETAELRVRTIGEAAAPSAG